MHSYCYNVSLLLTCQNQPSRCSALQTKTVHCWYTGFLLENLKDFTIQTPSWFFLALASLTSPMCWMPSAPPWGGTAELVNIMLRLLQLSLFQEIVSYMLQISIYALFATSIPQDGVSGIGFDHDPTTGIPPWWHEIKVVVCNAHAHDHTLTKQTLN